MATNMREPRVESDVPIQNADRYKNRITSVTQVTEYLKCLNKKENFVISGVDHKVTPSLHALSTLGAVALAEEYLLCMGVHCPSLVPGIAPSCKETGLTVYQIYEVNEGCPHGQWRRYKSTSTEAQLPSTCNVCGGRDWWQPKIGATRICNRCHPPVVPESQLLRFIEADTLSLNHVGDQDDE